jgi:hypothetical protein
MPAADLAQRTGWERAVAGKHGVATHWALALGGLIWAAAPARATEPAAFPRLRHHLSNGVAVHVAPVVALAARRLGEPECGGLLTEFTDERGRPLEQRLVEPGIAREAYLGYVVFVDGRNTRACQRSHVLAVTNPGGRVVALCPSFVRVVREDRGLAQAILIHEMLHTLGLGENPPSSCEINRRIFERCGRR